MSECAGVARGRAGRHSRARSPRTGRGIHPQSILRTQHQERGTSPNAVALTLLARNMALSLPYFPGSAGLQPRIEYGAGSASVVGSIPCAPVSISGNVKTTPCAADVVAVPCALAGDKPPRYKEQTPYTRHSRESLPRTPIRGGNPSSLRLANIATQWRATRV